jgi:hypothetical protein
LRGAGCRTVVFWPGRPNPHHVLYKLLHAAGWRIANDPSAACDLAIFWSYSTVRQTPSSLHGLAERVPVLNLDCLDISKRRVDQAATDAFGYDIRIDPISHVGPCVCKSDENARHDGRVVAGPIFALEPGSVYERLVDNRTGGGLVEDIRLPIFGDSVPFGYRKFRPIAERFSNLNVRVELAAVNDLMTADELLCLVAFCRSIGLDYGEVDAMRDREDGRLYVVDANPTPFGPPNHIPAGDGRRAMAMLAEAFERAFSPGRYRPPTQSRENP